MTATKATEVRADRVLPMSAEQACDRLVRSLGLAAGASQLDLVVGPRRDTHFPAKHVHGTIRGPQRRGSTYVFSLHWEPTGPVAAAYPALDATLGITPIDATGCLLAVVGRYAPPFGAIGATADRAVLSRVGNATVTSVLHSLADAIRSVTR